MRLANLFSILLSLSLFFCLIPPGTEDGFVGLKWWDCPTSLAYSCPFLLCCKTQRDTAGIVLDAVYHPAFYLGPPLFSFPVKRKHLLRGGKRVLLLPPPTERLKGRLMEGTFTYKTSGAKDISSIMARPCFLLIISHSLLSLGETGRKA